MRMPKAQEHTTRKEALYVAGATRQYTHVSQRAAIGCVTAMVAAAIGATSACGSDSAPSFAGNGGSDAAGNPGFLERGGTTLSTSQQRGGGLTVAGQGGQGGSRSLDDAGGSAANLGDATAGTNAAPGGNSSVTSGVAGQGGAVRNDGGAPAGSTEQRRLVRTGRRRDSGRGLERQRRPGRPRWEPRKCGRLVERRGRRGCRLQFHRE